MKKPELIGSQHRGSMPTSMLSRTHSWVYLRDNDEEDEARVVVQPVC